MEEEEETEEDGHGEEGKEGRKGGCWCVFPSSGRDVGEVNCRKLRGSVRGPAPAILWGRNWGSCVCMCRSEKGRRPVNHPGEKEETLH